MSPVSPLKFRGLYLILDAAWEGVCSLPEVVQQAGKAGVRIVQYRDKVSSIGEAYHRAHGLRETAREWGMLFIVNDRCDLALALDADGVHLGQQDLPLTYARNVMGKDRAIGVSTHTISQVRVASEGGADYLGFGPIFPTGTKLNLDPVVGIEGLKEVRGVTSAPIFAIGGIGPNHVNALRRAGADGVAVASAVLNAKDIPGTLEAFMETFREEM